MAIHIKSTHDPLAKMLFFLTLFRDLSQTRQVKLLHVLKTWSGQTARKEQKLRKNL